MLLGRPLAGTKIALVVEIHAIGDGIEAVLAAVALHDGEELIFAVEAALCVVAGIIMERYRGEHGFDAIAYGVNLDDQGDFRPDQRAAQQHRVVAPLLEAKLAKADVRELARLAGLRIWEKPASACLASRIEYGRAVTAEALSAVEQGEEALRRLGFRQYRVRHHGAIVRIEIAREELPRALSPAMAAAFTGIFKQLGFNYVTLDLEGFRSGSMNAVLPAELIARAR